MDELLTNNSNNEESENNSITISLISNKEIPLNGKEIIKQFKKIENCSVMKYGIKRSPELIQYAYCITCDDNLIHPICLECIEKCHKSYNHIVKYSEILFVVVVKNYIYLMFQIKKIFKVKIQMNVLILIGVIKQD